MALNDSKGNMYKFVTHTWNAIKGECSHRCPYCYMRKWGNQRPVRLDVKELHTDLGKGYFIFVGSSTDMFAADIPDEWILMVLDYCNKFDNKYLFQTKNPFHLLHFIKHEVFKKAIVCTTIETNRFYADIMHNSPSPQMRADAMRVISEYVKTYVTIEPVISFDLELLVDIIQQCRPKQVNIGADSGGNRLCEPTREEVAELINELQKFTAVKLKSNLKRIYFFNP